MTIVRIHSSRIATQRLQIFSDYADLSDDSNSSRGISQTAPEEMEISSEERKNSSEESNETSEESNHKSEEFVISSGGNPKYLPRYLGNSSGEIETSLLSLYYNALALRA